MSKPSTFPTIIDELRSVSVHNLSKWDYFKPRYLTGTLRWSRNGIETSAISIAVDAENTYLQLSYIKSSTKEEINYKVPLEGVQSNLGKGKVFYFICPFTGHRCRKLYSIGKYYMSRKALSHAMYESQTKSKKWRDWEKAYGGVFEQDKWYKELYSKHFKAEYNGKPTKRFLKLMQKIEAVPKLEPGELSRILIG